MIVHVRGYDDTWSSSVLFLEHQILKDPIRAFLADSIISDHVVLLLRPSYDWSLRNPGVWGSPLDPTPSVIKLVWYPAFFTDDTSSLYLASFLIVASTIRVSYVIVSSTRRIIFIVSSQQTVSGHRSVCAMCVGSCFEGPQLLR